MSAETFEPQYWFGFRVHGGQAIPCGPYRTREEALSERQRAKAADCSLSPPFVATTKEEAEERARTLT